MDFAATTAKIQDLAVTSAKIASLSVAKLDVSLSLDVTGGR